MSKLQAAIDSLSRVDLFQGFDRSVLQRLAEAAQERSYPAGQTIFVRGDFGDSIFIVLSGRVRLSVISAEGRELTLRHVNAGSVFGELALLDGGARSADATALQAATILTITQARFRRLIASEEGIEKALIIGLCTRLRDTTEQLEAIALLPLEVRLARLFLQLAKAKGSAKGKVRLDLDMSQGELASLIGASRPKVNQVLIGWGDAGLAVRKDGGYALDLASLRAVAMSDDEP
jgi:CRP/FNR family cyclic AMP-dependent transcriptional regulator